MIPINALSRHFAGTELHDQDNVKLDRLIGRRNAGQKPIHLLSMDELDVGLFDNIVIRYDLIGCGVCPRGGIEGINSSR